MIFFSNFIIKKMNWIKKIGIIIFTVVISGVLIHATSSDFFKEKKYHENVNFFNLKIDFAGEKIPLHISDVKERFDRELLVNVNWHSNTYLLLKRANRVFPVIEPILKKNGVPDDFKYLAVIESGLVNVVSPAGARGIWQFMTNTAKEYGMEVTNEIDERYHLEKATEAACSYLLAAKNKLGTWTLAAAAYNGGLKGIEKQINSQKVNDYYDLLLAEETSRYVFRIVAAKEVMTNPETYGYNLTNEQLYENIPVKKIEVGTSIVDWTDFALAQGINYKILKIHNPWLRDMKLMNPRGKKYTIVIPTKGY